MSNVTTKHLCLTCRLADWKKTATGRVHPGGDGYCRWKPAHIPTPASWVWSVIGGRRQPTPNWGQIARRPDTLIVECETYEAVV